MPSIAYWHPQVVHFVIALGMVGVILRLVSLTGRVSFTGPAAAALEVVALAMRTRPARRWVLMGSGAVGLVGVAALYRAGALGGELVYKYAGGIGTRYGDSTDVKRLLKAAYFQDAMADRTAKRTEAAAATIDEMAKRFPDDQTVQLMRAESMLLDRRDGHAALAALGQITVPPDDNALKSRHGTLRADAYVAAGFPDSARATLEELIAAFPANARIKQKLAEMKQ